MLPADDPFDAIRLGDRVDIAAHHGGILTGRVQAPAPDGTGWLVAVGGREGVVIARRENVLAVHPRRRKKKPGRLRR